MCRACQGSWLANQFVILALTSFFCLYVGWVFFCFWSEINIIHNISSNFGMEDLSGSFARYMARKLSIHGKVQGSGWGKFDLIHCSYWSSHRWPVRVQSNVYIIMAAGRSGWSDARLVGIVWQLLIDCLVMMRWTRLRQISLDTYWSRQMAPPRATVGAAPEETCCLVAGCQTVNWKDVCWLLFSRSNLHQGSRMVTQSAM